MRSRRPTGRSGGSITSSTRSARRADALTERHNGLRTELVELARGSGEAAAEEAEAAARPAIMIRPKLGSIALHIPGRAPLRAEIPPGQEARAEALILGFLMLFPAQPGKGHGRVADVTPSLS